MTNGDKGVGGGYIKKSDVPFTLDIMNCPKTLCIINVILHQKYALNTRIFSYYINKKQVVPLS